MAKSKEKIVETTVEAEAPVVETVEEAKVKKYLVETPVENFCGIGAAGIHFAYGKAEVHEGWVLDWYREHGYKVTEIK